MSAALLACIYSASILHMLQTLLLFHLFSSFFICVRYFMHEAIQRVRLPSLKLLLSKHPSNMKSQSLGVGGHKIAGKSRRY